MNENTYNLIENTDWKRISIELEEYAIYKAKRLYWKSGYRDLPQGKTPEDVAYEAIEKTLSGERNWNPDKNPDILSFLKSVVDSLIYHLVQSTNHKVVDPLPINPDGGIREDKIPNVPPDQEKYLLAEERERKLAKTILELTTGDSGLEAIMEAIMEGCIKAKNIAEASNMDVKHVYGLIRKLKLRVLKLDIDDILS